MESSYMDFDEFIAYLKKFVDKESFFQEANKVKEEKGDKSEDYKKLELEVNNIKKECGKWENEMEEAIEKELKELKEISWFKFVISDDDLRATPITSNLFGKYINDSSKMEIWTQKLVWTFLRRKFFGTKNKEGNIEGGMVDIKKLKQKEIEQILEMLTSPVQNNKLPVSNLLESRCVREKCHADDSKGIFNSQFLLQDLVNIYGIKVNKDGITTEKTGNKVDEYEKYKLTEDDKKTIMTSTEFDDVYKNHKKFPDEYEAYEKFLLKYCGFEDLDEATNYVKRRQSGSNSGEVGTPDTDPQNTKCKDYYAQCIKNYVNDNPHYLGKLSTKLYVDATNYISENYGKTEEYMSFDEYKTRFYNTNLNNPKTDDVLKKLQQAKNQSSPDKSQNSILFSSGSEEPKTLENGELPEDIDSYDENNFYGVDIKGMDHQSCLGVCGSTVAATMMTYEGLELSQQEIRAYVPENTNDEAERNNGFGNSTGTYNPAIFSDIIIKYKNNMAVRNLIIDWNNNKRILNFKSYVLPNLVKMVNKHNAKPILKQQDEERLLESGKLKASEEEIKARAEYLRLCIIDAIVKHKSPISLNTGGHYRLIVGIQGNLIEILDPDSPRYDKTLIKDIESIVRGANLQIDLLWFEHLDLENVNDQLKLKGKDEDRQVYDEQGNLCKDTENFKQSPYGGDFKKFMGTNTEDEERMENVKNQFPDADKAFEVTGDFFLPQKLVREQEKVEEKEKEKKVEINKIETEKETIIKINNENNEPEIKEEKEERIEINEEKKSIDNKQEEEIVINIDKPKKETNEIKIEENIEIKKEEAIKPEEMKEEEKPIIEIKNGEEEQPPKETVIEKINIGPREEQKEIEEEINEKKEEAVETLKMKINMKPEDKSTETNKIILGKDKSDEKEQQILLEKKEEEQQPKKEEIKTEEKIEELAETIKLEEMKKEEPIIEIEASTKIVEEQNIEIKKEEEEKKESEKNENNIINEKDEKGESLKEENKETVEIEMNAEPKDKPKDESEDESENKSEENNEMILKKDGSESDEEEEQEEEENIEIKKEEEQPQEEKPAVTTELENGKNKKEEIKKEEETEIKKEGEAVILTEEQPQKEEESEEKKIISKKNESESDESDEGEQEEEEENENNIINEKNVKEEPPKGGQPQGDLQIIMNEKNKEEEEKPQEEEIKKIEEKKENKENNQEQTIEINNKEELQDSLANDKDLIEFIADCDYSNVKTLVGLKENVLQAFIEQCKKEGKEKYSLLTDEDLAKVELPVNVIDELLFRFPSHNIKTKYMINEESKAISVNELSKSDIDIIDVSGFDKELEELNKLYSKHGVSSAGALYFMAACSEKSLTIGQQNKILALHSTKQLGEKSKVIEDDKENIKDELKSSQKATFSKALAALESIEDNEQITFRLIDFICDNIDFSGLNDNDDQEIDNFYGIVYHLIAHNSIISEFILKQAKWQTDAYMAFRGLCVLSINNIFSKYREEGKGDEAPYQKFWEAISQNKKNFLALLSRENIEAKNQKDGNDSYAKKLHQLLDQLDVFIEIEGDQIVVVNDETKLKQRLDKREKQLPKLSDMVIKSNLQVDFSIERDENDNTKKSKFPTWAKYLIGFGIAAVAVVAALFGFGVLGTVLGIAAVGTPKTIALVIAVVALFAELIYLAVVLPNMNRTDDVPGGRGPGSGPNLMGFDNNMSKNRSIVTKLVKGQKLGKVPITDSDSKMTEKNQKSQSDN